MKPTPVHEFFKASKNGPYRFARMSGEKKEFMDKLAETKAKVLNDAKLETSAIASTIEDELELVQSEKRKNSLKEARAKAKAVAGKAKARRTLSLQKSDA